MPRIKKSSQQDMYSGPAEGNFSIASFPKFLSRKFREVLPIDPLPDRPHNHYARGIYLLVREGVVLDYNFRSDVSFRDGAWTSAQVRASGLPSRIERVYRQLKPRKKK